MHPELAAAMGEFISLEGIAVAVPDSDDTDALIGEASETERIELRKSRIGQGRFRDSVIDYWRACAATGCDEPTLLIASHIVPWRESSNHERLDGFNGLLLIPNLDRLFDKGWISFDDDGRILRSPQLRDSVAGTLGLNDGIQIKNLHPQHREHLVRHRNDVFKAA
jgi:5-methylcytosine-specific restriction protein A